MTMAAGNPERAKFGYLLDLAQEQIQALESDDMFAFDRILAAKHSLIASLRDPPPRSPPIPPSWGSSAASRTPTSWPSACSTAKSVASCAR